MVEDQQRVQTFTSLTEQRHSIETGRMVGRYAGRAVQGMVLEMERLRIIRPLGQNTHFPARHSPLSRRLRAPLRHLTTDIACFSRSPFWGQTRAEISMPSLNKGSRAHGA